MPTEVSRLDRDTRLLERGFGLGERGVGNHRVFGAVDEKDRRPRTQLARQQSGASSRPEKPTMPATGSSRRSPTKSDIIVP